MKLLAQFKAFLQDEEGASGIEYALVAGMLVAILLLVAPALSGAVKAKFNEIIRALGGTPIA